MVNYHLTFLLYKYITRTHIMYNVFQIWIGGDMPGDDARWVAKVREACFMDDIGYTLYDTEKCSSTYFQALKFKLEKCPFLSQVQMNVILSDFARFEIFFGSHESMLYLDTDFVLLGEHMPVWTQEGVWGMAESFDRTKVCSGVLYKGKGRLEGMLKLLYDQVGNVFRYLDACIEGTLAWEPKQLMGLFGPVWYRKAIQEAGLEVNMLPETYFGHTRWGGMPTLIHVGRGVWM